MSDSRAINVPVFIDEVKVGTAEINTKGQLSIVFDEAHLFHAKTIVEFLTLGLSEGISIKPNIVPALAYVLKD
jgi:hypothetical protein